MRKTTLLKGLVPTLVLFSTQAAALPFQSIDPRTLGMGGVGVASGNSGNAGFLNPALLSTARDDEDFSLELPIIGARFHDPGDLLDEVDYYQDNNLEGNLDAAIDTFNTTPNLANAQAVGNAANAVLTQLLKFSNKPINGEVFAGMVVGIPSKKIGASLNVSASAVGGGMLDITAADQTLVQGIVDASGDPVTLLANSAIQEQLLGTEDVVNKLTSSLDARGAAIAEVGISLSREMTVGGHQMAFGITPKYVKVKTFDYRVDVNTADFDADTGTKEYSDFNFDIGVAKAYGNGWKSGFVIKNLLSNEYETVLGNVIKIEPQARVGVSRANDWLTLAADLDITENEPAGFESKSQYLGLGAEFDLFGWAQLRAGYRHNLSDSNTSMPTLGVGLSPFGVHIDIAAAGNDDEIAVAAQLGFRF